MIGSRPDFMDWIEIIDNVPHLKKDAPDSVRLDFEEYQHLQEVEEPVPEEKV